MMRLIAARRAPISAWAKCAAIATVLTIVPMPGAFAQTQPQTQTPGASAAFPPQTCESIERNCMAMARRHAEARKRLVETGQMLPEQAVAKSHDLSFRLCAQMADKARKTGVWPAYKAMPEKPCIK